MGLNANKVPASGARVEPIEAGTYPARLVHVIDLGLQPQPDWQGQAKPPAYKLLTTYELLDEFMLDEDGEELTDKPRHLSENFALYNLEQDKAKSTKRYLALDPSQAHAGNWAALVETPVNLTVVQNAGKGNNAGKIYNNIAGTSPMRPRDAAKAPPLVNAPVIFDMEAPDLEAYKAIPEWVQKIILSGLEFKGSVLEAMLAGAPAPAPQASKPDEAPDDGAELDGDEIPF